MYYKNVICVISDINHENSSGQMRGYQLYEFFKKCHKDVFFNPNNDNLKNYDNSYKFILLLIKNIKKNISHLLNYSNKLIIWDIIDTFEKIKNGTELLKNDIFKKNYNVSDIINCPNSKMMEVIKNNNSLNKTITFIPHNWDNRSNKYYYKSLNNENLDNIKIAFLGSPNSVYDHLILKNKEELNLINLGRVLDYNNLGSFNVCCCLRKKEEAFGKPSTKSYVAASINCCIIASKNEYGIVDIFGEDYPYYIEDNNDVNLNNIKNTITYVKQTYNTEVWYKALNIIKDVRKKTDIETIGKHFLEIINN